MTTADRINGFLGHGARTYREVVAHMALYSIPEGEVARTLSVLTSFGPLSKANGRYWLHAHHAPKYAGGEDERGAEMNGDAKGSSVFTEEKRRAFLECYATGRSVDDVCRSIGGVSPATVYTTRKNDAEFRARMMTIKLDRKGAKDGEAAPATAKGGTRVRRTAPVGAHREAARRSNGAEEGDFGAALRNVIELIRDHGEKGKRAVDALLDLL